MNAGFKPPCSEVFLRCGAQRDVVFRPSENAADDLRKLASAFFDAKGVLTPNAFDRFEDFIQRAAVMDDVYPYERAGALFAARAGRSLIADDMGLDKTIQAIAAVEILARAAKVERVLVVTPTSLKHQWKSELEKFTDRSVEVINGMQLARSHKYGTESFYKIAN